VATRPLGFERGVFRSYAAGGSFVIGVAINVMLLRSLIAKRKVAAVLLAVAVGVALALLSFANQSSNAQSQTSPRPPATGPASDLEYLWYEAENMRGLTTNSRHEPILNPSYLELPASKAPGWGISGPGVSAEWSQGGESEWNSVAASADETRGSISLDVEVPRGGEYRLWVRYADFANRNESFVVSISQGGREIFHHEFGEQEIIDSHDETELYWGWAFAWNSASATLAKGPASVSIQIRKAAEARRQVDCFLLTNDLAFAPDGRQKPDFAAMRYLRDWSVRREAFTPLLAAGPNQGSSGWQRRSVAGREFLVPWNISKEFWQRYDKPPSERPLYPFNAEPVDEFIKVYAGKRDVPIFDSKLIAPVVSINDLPELLKAGSGFRRYLAETKSPFAVLINYGAANFASDAEAQTAWKLLNGELRAQFLGWISGESVGFVWDDAPKYLKIFPEMSRAQLLEAHRVFYTDALSRKWGATFKTEAGPMWDKLMPAQSTSSTSFAHALAEWGVRSIGIETAAVQPMTAMRLAFNRGAARQYGGEFFYYHAPNFGDSATTFTKEQNFAGPDNFFHSRYGATMGPSLSWYRKSYYLYYMSGASAIYLEQGFDQFFKPGPGEHPFQLNPLGRITEEFVRFAEKHPDRGEPYTPIAFLLDPAHGWDMTDYPQWPFGVSQINRSDRALRELFGAAYYPGPVREGEPASGERQAFVPGIFGNIFDVLVASNATGVREMKKSGPDFSPVKNQGRDAPVTALDAINSYRAAIVGGQINWTKAWAEKLEDYVRLGGTLVLNSAQVKGLSNDLLGVRFRGETGEAHNARCLSPGEPAQDLHGQIFRYDRVELKTAQALITTTENEPLVTVNRIGRGTVVLIAVPDLLGEDERLTPLAAHLLTHLAAGATPVRIEGDVEYLINRNSRGWVVTIFNDNGVFKPQQGLAQIDRSARVTATISLRGLPIASANEWTTDRLLPITKKAGSADAVTVEIAAGGVAVVELLAGR
jgi:hypothetical protein